MATLHRLSDHRRKARSVFFSRRELDQLLSLYSRQVMRGEWRDYAIDQQDNSAVFSIFRRAQERPLYSIVKFAPGAGRQGEFAIMMGPRRLASGSVLADVLASLQKRLPAARPVEIEQYR